MITPQTLKGFRDFLPSEAVKRQYVTDIIRKTFELYGFEPLETPAIEYLETFTGNIGEDEHLFYKFTDMGGREVALRYDQTVPTCRLIAQYPDKIQMPFKRYQIQTVWRAEKPQKGRYREFLQCDADIFGVTESTADGETAALSIDIFRKLGFQKPLALINDRELYADIPYKAIVTIDKLEKNGEQQVIAELMQKGFTESQAHDMLTKIKNNQPNDNLKAIFSYLDNYGMKDFYRFAPTLARSFSYSTGTIWEITVDGFTGGSLAGCERFDSLVSRFADRKVPAVGFAIGFDRTILAMDELGLFPPLDNANAMCFISVFNDSTLPYSQKIAAILRDKNINCDLYPDTVTPLNKQIKYADRKGIRFLIIAGPDEMEDKKVTVKNLKTREQKTITLDELPGIFTKNP